MKIASKLKMALACIAFLSFAVSCDSDDDNPKPVDNTITGNAVKNSNLKILVQALTRAELAATLQGTGPLYSIRSNRRGFYCVFKNYSLRYNQ